MKINQMENYIKQQSKQEFTNSELIELSNEIKKFNTEFENYEIQKKYFDIISETITTGDEFILSLAILDKNITIPLINSTEKFQNLANYFEEKYGKITFNFLKIPYFISKFNLEKNSDDATLELYKAMFWNGNIQKFYNRDKNNIGTFFNYFQLAYLHTEKKVKTFKWLYENHKKILEKDPGSIYDSDLLWITRAAKYATEFHFDTLDFLIENLDKEYYGLGYPEIDYGKGTRLLQIKVFEQLNIFLDALEYIAPSKNYKEKIKEFKFYQEFQ